VSDWVFQFLRGKLPIWAEMHTGGPSEAQASIKALDEIEKRIATLTAEVARLTGERDAACDLLKQLNPNRGLFLNGVAIGWNKDHIAGFVAGIGGSKTIYPTILDAIRAALDQKRERET